MEIKYEKMTKSDYPEIKNLIKEAWFNEYPFGRKYIKQYEDGYLYASPDFYPEKFYKIKN